MVVACREAPDFFVMARDRYVVFDLVQNRTLYEDGDFKWELCERFHPTDPVLPDRSNQRRTGILDASEEYAEMTAQLGWFDAAENFPRGFK